MSNPYPGQQQPGPQAPYGAPSHATSSDPLSQPLYGASFGQAVGRFFKKYAQFNGRASRSEFLWSALFNAIILGVLYAIFIGVTASASMAAQSTGTVSGGASAGLIIVGVIMGLYSLAVLVPTLAVQVRRLHDAGFSGFLVLLSIVGLGIVTFILCCLPTSPNGDRYNV